MAEYLGVDYVVSCNSCSDALRISLQSLGIGPDDEVITVSHTFIATIEAIIHCGAKPVFVDVGMDFNMDTNLIEQAITSRTKAILPVHLNGRACDMYKIQNIAIKYDLKIIEDVAQSIGAKYNGQMTGTFGDAGCFSLHPMKSLSVIGNGGFVAIWNKHLADNIRLLCDHGQETKDNIILFGYESELDTIQAAIATIKLKYLDQWIEERRKKADYYFLNLANILTITVPVLASTYNSYSILAKKRDELKRYLWNENIETQVHWPTPIHKQPLGLGFWNLPVTDYISKHVLSLPIYPELTEKEQDEIIKTIRFFYAKKDFYSIPAC